jgi:hypothetical protein
MWSKQLGIWKVLLWVLIVTFIAFVSEEEAHGENEDTITQQIVGTTATKVPERPTNTRKTSLSQQLNRLLGGDWVSGTDEEVQQEFNQPNHTEEYQTLQCLKQAARDKGDIGRARSKCKCTASGLCKQTGKRACYPVLLSYSKLTRRLTPKHSGNADSTSPSVRGSSDVIDRHRQLSQTKTGGGLSPSRAAFLGLFHAFRGRHVCLLGDSVTKQIAFSLANAAARDSSRFREVKTKTTPHTCVRGWRGCMQEINHWTICPKSGACVEVTWLKHYDFEPYDFELLWTHRCDVLIYNLARWVSLAPFLSFLLFFRFRFRPTFLLRSSAFICSMTSSKLTPHAVAAMFGICLATTITSTRLVMTATCSARTCHLHCPTWPSSAHRLAPTTAGESQSTIHRSRHTSRPKGGGIQGETTTQAYRISA